MQTVVVNNFRFEIAQRHIFMPWVNAISNKRLDYIPFFSFCHLSYCPGHKFSFSFLAAYSPNLVSQRFFFFSFSNVCGLGFFRFKFFCLLKSFFLFLFFLFLFSRLGNVKKIYGLWWSWGKKAMTLLDCYSKYLFKRKRLFGL